MINRNAAEADIKVQQTAANEIRSILGLPFRAENVEGETSDVWLNRILLEDAINCGTSKYNAKYGCSTPVIK